MPSASMVLVVVATVPAFADVCCLLAWQTHPGLFGKKRRSQAQSQYGENMMSTPVPKRAGKRRTRCVHIVDKLSRCCFAFFFSGFACIE